MASQDGDEEAMSSQDESIKEQLVEAIEDEDKHEEEEMGEEAMDSSSDGPKEAKIEKDRPVSDYNSLPPYDKETMQQYRYIDTAGILSDSVKEDIVTLKTFLDEKEIEMVYKVSDLEADHFRILSTFAEQALTSLSGSGNCNPRGIQNRQDEASVIQNAGYGANTERAVDMGTSSRENVESGTSTSLIQNTECGTSTSLIQNTDSGTSMSLTQNTECGTSMSLFQTVNCGTDMSLIQTVNCGTDMSLTQNVNCGTNMSLIQNTECGTSTSLIQNTECGTSMSLTQTQNVNCGTDMSLTQTVNCGTSMSLPCWVDMATSTTGLEPEEKTTKQPQERERYERKRNQGEEDRRRTERRDQERRDREREDRRDRERDERREGKRRQERCRYDELEGMKEKSQERRAPRSPRILVPAALHDDRRIRPTLHQFQRLVGCAALEPCHADVPHLGTGDRDGGDAAGDGDGEGGILLAPCVVASRVGSDINAVFEKLVQVSRRVLLVLFHHRAPHNSRIGVPTKQRLSDATILDRCTDILDVVFWNGDIYDCATNRTAVANMQAIVEGHGRGY